MKLQYCEITTKKFVECRWARPVPPQPEQGSVDFYWVPFGMAYRRQHRLHAGRTKLDPNSAQAIGPDGQLDIPQGQSF